MNVNICTDKEPVADCDKLLAFTAEFVIGK